MSEAAATNPPAASGESAEAKEARIAKRTLWLRRLALVVLVLGLLWALWYILVGRNHTSTDDAYVAAETAQVTPLSAGTVLAVHVSDTQEVKAGQLLVELDPATARIGLASAEADLAAARRRFRQAVANSGALAAQVGASGQGIVQAEAALATARADAAKARTDLSRRESVVAAGGVSGEELTAARTADAAAQAAVRRAEAALAQARAGQVSAQGQSAAAAALVSGNSEDNDPAVLAAKARLEAARIELGHMVLRAPIDGVVTRRQVQVGQQVAQGAPIMSIVPVRQVYIEANFKERQLRRVRIGMPAEVVADIYGSGVTYHGKVVGIGGGTGSSQALIPAQNASGNWIKIVQRLPVRIALDPKELAEHPLRVGLSTEATIDLSGN
ncbi:MAG: HlyD family efflux transporter periplasmic adaptor subunit [Sphingomonadales bacterium]|nr:HlyD family efflux transporter periplasmic adaptor subunit [Sphingomonadales bacterium]